MVKWGRDTYQDRKQRLEDPLQPRKRENKADKLPIGAFFLILLAIFVIYGFVSAVFGYHNEFMEQAFHWVTTELFTGGGDNLEL
ncbi:hypothetical protein [Marinococcus luteus]|uniref:hypothetical protein n=1 Tax=Marinococcus luteus TaxID=1122204 RepID=UPI002ACCD0EF|nr:hypothetical protein [Marinococcus luteus]MDZ5781948.1 hypothetical protein [Marinococcus luteus]